MVYWIENLTGSARKHKSMLLYHLLLRYKVNIDTRDGGNQWREITGETIKGTEHRSQFL